MRILDLGCGAHKYKGKGRDEVIGLDRVKLPGVDVVCNLEKGKLPFPSNHFDLITARHILEHISNIRHLMNELIRVLKPNGTIKIWVPHFSSYVAYLNLEHIRFFSVDIFDMYYEKEYDTKFKVVKKRINYVSDGATNKVMKGLDKIVTPLVNLNQRFYEKFLSGLISCDEIYFELKRK